MNDFKEKLLFVIKDILLVFAVGALSIVAITILRLLSQWAMAMTSETSAQLFLLTALEYIHVGWTIGATLLLVWHSLYRLVILLYGRYLIEKK